MEERHGHFGLRLPDVLLVEDNPLHVRLVQTMLREVWSDISTLRVATRLDVAISYLEESVPDLVLLDLVLPDADHLDGLHTMLDFVPNTPIVVLSAHEDEEHAVQALAAGAQDYLVKGRVGSDGLARAMRFAMIRGGVARPHSPAPTSAGMTGRAIVGLDGVVHRVDADLAEMTGLLPGQLVGGHVMGLTIADDASRWTELLTDITAETPPRKKALGLRTSDGAGRFVTVDLVPMLSGEAVTEVVVSFSSLTGAPLSGFPKQPSAVSA